MFCEKATNFGEITTLDMTVCKYIVSVKSKVEISQNFVAFSEYVSELYQQNGYLLFNLLFGKKGHGNESLLENN